MKWLEEARQKALKLFDSSEWVKWVHEGTKKRLVESGQGQYVLSVNLKNIFFTHIIMRVKKPSLKVGDMV